MENKKEKRRTSLILRDRINIEQKYIQRKYFKNSSK
jgi:hypothetical protein